MSFIRSKTKAIGTASGFESRSGMENLGSIVRRLVGCLVLMLCGFEFFVMLLVVLHIQLHH